MLRYVIDKKEIEKLLMNSYRWSLALFIGGFILLITSYFAPITIGYFQILIGIVFLFASTIYAIERRYWSTKLNIITLNKK